MIEAVRRVRVKICGVRTPEEARWAAEAGADAIGINFHPPSPRYVRPENAAAILAEVPAFVEPVAVVVNPTRELLDYLVREVGFRTVQVHAGEPSGDWRGVGFVLAAAVGDLADLQRAESQLQTWLERGLQVTGVLLDARVPGQYGGTGRTAPWPLVAQFSRRRPLILAGGLTPENVAMAIQTVRPWAVDVASGVEVSPGVKDRDKIRRFVQAVWDASCLGESLQ